MVLSLFFEKIINMKKSIQKNQTPIFEEDSYKKWSGYQSSERMQSECDWMNLGISSETPRIFGLNYYYLNISFNFYSILDLRRKMESLYNKRRC